MRQSAYRRVHCLFYVVQLPVLWPLFPIAGQDGKIVALEGKTCPEGKRSGGSESYH